MCYQLDKNTLGISVGGARLTLGVDFEEDRE